MQIFISKGVSNMNEKHYELTNETKTVEYQSDNGIVFKKLTRIRAIRDFSVKTRISVIIVRKGELGGFIEDESNLPQGLSGWVDCNSSVFGGVVVKNHSAIRASTLCGNILCDDRSYISRSEINRRQRDKGDYYYKIRDSFVEHSIIDSPIELNCFKSEIKHVVANRESYIILHDGVTLRKCTNPSINLMSQSGYLYIDNCVFKGMLFGENVTGRIKSCTFHTDIHLKREMDLKHCEFTEMTLLDGNIEMSHVTLKTEFGGNVRGEAKWSGVVLEGRKIEVHEDTVFDNVYGIHLNDFYIMAKTTLMDVKMIGNENKKLEIHFSGESNVLKGNAERQQGDSDIVHQIVLSGKNLAFRNVVISESFSITGGNLFLRDVNFSGFSTIESKPYRTVSLERVKMSDWSSIKISESFPREETLVDFTLHDDESLIV